ncbi:MAG: glycerol-3-phosphate 1-O-acyltransferase PlsY, partial [Candidatus Omnitrophota bacterium]|nr:glycerol-3-phosphate 1-O-acyltransferase PlsY [Candidatus Omnitrophota bacterium]
MIPALLGSYLIGSIPTGFLLVKWLKRVDLRTVGSGNIGATNVGRVAGRGASAAVFLIDAAKGIVPVLLIAPQASEVAGSTAALACGLAAVLGHNFPLFLKFKGGKGVATTIGVLLSAMPLVGAVYLLVWGACLMIWRYVSLGSMAAAVSIPLMQVLLRRCATEIWLGAALALLIVARHRANIDRLRQGIEPRVG